MAFKPTPAPRAQPTPPPAAPSGGVDRRIRIDRYTNDWYVLVVDEQNKGKTQDLDQVMRIAKDFLAGRR